MSKKFTYGKLNTFNRVSMFFLSVSCFLLGLIYLWRLISLLVVQGTKLSLSASQLFWYFIGFSVWTPFVYAFLSYLTTDIVVQEDGLQIKFVFRKLFVKWDDIIEFRPARIFGLRIMKKATILVTKKSLTPFHRSYGLMYGEINKPALLIWSYISDYESLAAIIKENLKQRRLAIKK